MFERHSNRARYINPLTDFGFKRLFGTEPNKVLLIDFLNVVLPEHHRIEDLSYGNSEHVGNTPLDRKAIFDIYCQTAEGDRFLVEIQKAKQNFFKDRSVYYTSFPIQEQGKQGDWNYKVSPVYAVGILDFVFDDHKHESTILHTVELKNQWCEVSYDKLKFLYLELPKFTKGIDQLETHFDKWLFLLKHLPRLDDPPELLQNQIFIKLFEVAEISDFSWEERDAYENSLKYYRDLKNVLDTAKEEGIEEERARGLQRQKALLTRQLSRKLGDISPEQLDLINQLSSTSLEELAEIFLDFENRSVLEEWLSQQS